MTWTPSRVWRYSSAFAVVALSTLLAEGLYRVFDTTRLSMIFLAGVLVAAVSLGSGPGYFAAVLAFIVYNFYLVEPRFTIEFASAEDVIVLATFLSVAMLTGSLAGRVRDEALRARDRARTTAALFQASQEFSSAGDEEEIRAGLARHVAQAAKGDALVGAADRTWSAPEFFEPSLELVAAMEEGGGAIPVGWRRRALRSSNEDIGWVAWRSAERKIESVDDDRLIEVLIDLGATAIARARLGAIRAEMEAAKRTERLRIALLSSISHDLRTPLASILASASSLRDFGGQFNETVRSDLIVTIEEEAERLNRFVGNLLSMTKLEADSLVIHVDAFQISEVVDRVLRRAARRIGDRNPLRISGPQHLLVSGDPILLEQALDNVIHNAGRFTPDGSAIDIWVRADGASVVIDVADEGPGVPTGDLERIFEKFFRSASTAEGLQGTGLGLSITKGFLEAMGGSVSARLGPGGRGLVVSLSVPRAVKGEHSR